MLWQNHGIADLSTQTDYWKSKKKLEMHCRNQKNKTLLKSLSCSVTLAFVSKKDLPLTNSLPLFVFCQLLSMRNVRL